MMTPTTALNRFADEKRKHDLYLNETRVDLRYGFSIGDIKFLLGPLEKVEVIDAAPACPVPNTPGWFAGMFNLRGDVFPLFDINFLITKNAVMAKWIMVFNHNGKSAGVYIDTLPYGVNLDAATGVPPNLPDILRGCINNVYMQGDSLWFETDFEKIFLKLRDRF